MSKSSPQASASAGAAAHLIDVLRDGEPEEDALRAALTDTDALVGPVVAVVEAAGRGEELDEGSGRLAFFGVHLLAAAGRRELWRPLLASLRLPGEALDALFGDALTETFPSVLIAVFDGDAAPAVALLADPEADGSARWAVAEVLAELAVQGRLDRSVAIEALRNLAAGVGDNDSAWFGWHEAVLRMRAAELVPLARLLPPRSPQSMLSADSEAFERALAALAADPSSPPAVATKPIEPLSDPAVALAFSQTEDPAAEVALDLDEIGWLAEFLASPPCRPTSMNIEMLDGFLAGVVAGPGGLDFETIVEAILDGGFQPGTKVAKADRKRFEALIERSLATIDLRLSAGAFHDPFLFPKDVLDEIAGDADAEDRLFVGMNWAAGFMTAVRHGERTWTAALDRDQQLEELIYPITVLASPDSYRDEAGVTVETLTTVSDEFPDALLGLYDYWRAAEAERMVPARSSKVGRNEPCSCGSGKKYKRCCGAAA